ncbi:MAG TPA: glycoside hydrolase family 3 N-terminal domain-containing protein [Solirubrobacteraceae bacterium]
MVEQDRRRRLRRLLAAAGALMAIAAVVLIALDPLGDDGGGDVPEAGSRFGQGASEGDQSLLDALAPVLGAKATEEEVPVEQAVAQLFAVGFEGREPPRRLLARMRDRAWGLVLVGEANYASPAQLRGVVGAVERAARRGRQAAPLFAATEPDALGRLGPPPAPDLGLDGTTQEVRAEALAAARRLREAHVRMVLGPSADLAIGGGPAEDRGFTDDPPKDAAFVEAAVSGWKEARVVVAPGRFPGEGGASQDPLFGAATVGLSVEELEERDVEPFAAAVRAGADAIQMSAALYAAWDGVTPATVLPEAIRFLRTSTGFDGAVVSADLVAATGATGGGVARAAVEALRSGCDLLVLAGGREEQEAAYRAVLGAVRRNEIPRARFLEAVRRVAALKKAAQAG